MMAAYEYDHQRMKLLRAGKLFNALLEENEEAIANELVNGANPNLLLPEEGITPFHYVVGGAEDKLDLTALFLCYHANPNVRSSEGLTPLHVAATWGREESVQLLLQNGASPNALDENGQTALEMAYDKGHINIVAIIQEFAVSDEIEEPELPKYVKRLRCVLDGETLSRLSSSMSEKLTQDEIEEATHGIGSLLRDRSFESDVDTSLCSVSEHTNANKQDDSFESERASDTNTHDGSFESERASNAKTHDSSFESERASDANTHDGSFESERASDANTHDGSFESKSQRASNANMQDGSFESERATNAIASKQEGSFKSERTALLRLRSPRTAGDGASTCTCSLDITQELQKLLKELELEGEERNGSAELEQILQQEFTFSKHRVDVTSPDHPNIQVKSRSDTLSDLDATIATSSSDSYHSCEEDVQGDVIENSPLGQQSGGDASGCSKSKRSRLNSKLNETFTLDSSGNIITSSSPSSCQIEDKCTQVRLSDNKTVPFMSAQLLPTFSISRVPDVMREQGALSGQFDDADSLLSDDISLLSLDRSSGRSSLSDSTIIYEYQYTDIEDGHELIERHFVRRSATPSPDTTVCSCNSNDSVPSIASSTPSIASSAPSVASSVCRLDNHQVRNMLQNFGDVPGPVTESTRLTYLRRLTRLKRDPTVPRRIVKPTATGYSRELETLLKNTDGLSYSDFTSKDEQEMISSFSDPTRTWREGSLKASFNYLLLDSSITQNLPMAANLSEHEKFKVFINSVFYIGKGKRSRPYCHFYEALDSRKKGSGCKVSNKVERILGIWNQGLGVVSLHVFQNVLPVEAYTSEAAMMNAIGLANLTNIRKGDYYGLASTWTLGKKRAMGTFLLLKAFHIFLLEGERQIRPGDIKTGE